MTKKGHPNIPDFSHKHPTKPTAAGLPPQKSTIPKTKPAPKPQATSQKSGRRGQ